jgi:hypothetical protein
VKIISLTISSIKYKESGTSISFHPYNLTLMPSVENKDGVYE